MARSSSSFLYCQLCDIHTSSEEQLRSHMLGQRHWFNVRQHEQASRSVFVRGFRSSVTEEELTQIFERFGSVRGVVLGDKGKFAIVEFSSEDGAVATLRFPGKLLLHGLNLTVKPRDIKVRKGKKKGRRLSEGGEGSEQDEPLVEETTESRAQGHMEAVDMEMEAEPDAHSGLSWEDILSFARVDLTESDKHLLKTSSSIDEQILTLARAYQLPSEALSLRLSLLSSLQSQLRSIYPSCLLLPFGSTVLGLATSSSDVDTTLLLEPSVDDKLFFIESDYLSAFGQGASTKVANCSSALPFTNLTEGSEDMDIATDSSPFVTSPVATSACVTYAGSKSAKSYCSPELERVLSVVRTVPGIVKVLVLPQARCPIARCFLEPSRLHCDISIENRLGLHNTRMLKAYLQFDGRVLPLLLVLRVWVRSCGVGGISRTQLNNYALALLLVYALQRSEPPVLPCLQCPGHWPKNMAWYSGRLGGPSTNHGECRRTASNGWTCGFYDPATLMPSSNTATIGELLLHFFRFYSEQFDFSSHAVAIHTSIGQLLSVSDAATTAEQNVTESVPDKLRTFKISSMCVQDPFELTHNVTKSVNSETFSILLEEMKRAFKIVSTVVCPGCEASKQTSTQSSLLRLFDPCVHASFPRAVLKSPKLTHHIFLTSGKITSLFMKIPSLIPLVDHIGPLSTSSQHVLDKLGLVVLSAMIQLLERDLGFECVPVRDVILPSPLQDDSSAVLPTALHVHESTDSFASQALQVDVSRKRSRDSETSSMDEDTFFMDNLTSDEAKRARTMLEEEDPSLILLSQLAFNEEGVLRPSCYRCTAHTNTWLNRRKLRRQMKIMESSLEECAVSMLPSPSSDTPLHPALQMVVSVLDPVQTHQVKDAVCSIKLQLDNESFMSDFQLFFAFFKKFAFSKHTVA